MFSLLKNLPILTVLAFSATKVNAGAYIFADEVNGPDWVTHPNTYTGNGGVVTVRVCIAPASPNATDMEYSIQNNIAAYNQLAPTTANIKLGNNNNIPAGFLDFESVALHEIGHCLGMAHINAASESGLSGNQTNYSKATDGADNVFNLDAGTDGVIGSSDDIRGDDGNLVWFKRSNNDPFTIDTVIDSTTYSRYLADLPAAHTFAANADRAVSTLLGYPVTEAVMQQGTFYDEAQRTLGHDDVATLRYAASGIDERESGRNYAADNYSIVLEYGGISDVNCDISMGFTSTTGLAFCAVGGTGIASDHARITTANIEFGQGFNWFFNTPNTAPVLNPVGDSSLLEGDILVVNISAADVDANTLSFSASGLPSFATLIDNNDGTAILTIAPAAGESSLTSVTVTVADDGTPLLSDSAAFNIEVTPNSDSDGDGLSDADEINIYGTLPNNPDSDGDGVDDYDEIIIWGSNPLISGRGDLGPYGSPDNTIDLSDYLVLTRMVIGEITPTAAEIIYGDLNDNDELDAGDLVIMLRVITGEIPLP